MDWKFTLQIFVALLGGGAFGAVLKMFYDARQNRVPPVHYRIELDRIFSTAGGGGLRATVTVEHDGQNYNFENVSLVKIRLLNRSHHHHETFAFGVTLPFGFNIFKYEGISKNRYHQLTCRETPTPAQPMRELNFACTPFNRGETGYLIKLYIQSADARIETDQVAVETAAAVKLTRISGNEELPKHISTLTAILSGGASSIAIISFIYTSLILWRQADTLHRSEISILKSEQVQRSTERDLSDLKQLETVKEILKENEWLRSEMKKSDKSADNAAKTDDGQEKKTP